ncbi:hypothetical protein BJ742DRAFT_772704 [Cladochytrium replicatum]|nr:hypothetical protein BJ742DRAFT_772704 [Cladochytrium replicatum]
MPSISSPTLLNNTPFRNFGAKKSKPADLHSISSEKTKVEPSPDPSHQEYLRRIAEEQKRTLPQLFVYAILSLVMIATYNGSVFRERDRALDAAFAATSVADTGDYSVADPDDYSLYTIPLLHPIWRRC